MKPASTSNNTAIVLQCKPGEVRIDGRCLYPLPKACKPGEVLVGSRCLSPDRPPFKAYCGEAAAPDVAITLTLVAVFSRLVCR